MSFGSVLEWQIGVGSLVFAVSVACTAPERLQTTVTDVDTADQVIFGLTHLITEDGVLRAQLEADTAYFYDATQVADLSQLRVVFFSGTGEETSVLTADSGRYEWRTGNMDAYGDVVGVTPDGRRLTTSVLSYEKRRNSLVGPEAFVFDAPDQHLEGSSFTADPDFTNVQATSVRGTPGRMDVRNQ